MRKLTQEQAIVVTGYTGYMCVKNFGAVHEDIERRLGRPVWTHEIPAIMDDIRAAYKDDFLSLVPEEVKKHEGEMQCKHIQS